MIPDLKGFIKPGSVEDALVRRLDFKRLPVHVAVIMDGNGRWAKRRNLPRVEGHRAGSKSVRAVVEASARLGIKVLSLYAFSKENWKRPRNEVALLWSLLEDYLKKEDRILVKNDIRLRVIGQKEGIPASVRRQIDRVEALTADNTRMTCCLALNYGGRSEIVDGVRRLLADPKTDPAALDEDSFGDALYTAGLPDPDLLIRTSGELRVSNFLLWQIAYAEIWVTPELWPDFRARHLLEAFIDYQKRERRFGAVSPGGGAGSAKP
ncbi:MAG: isoprenyl transferase [Candidatus Aminicenantes bacterium]|nr:isoprenyl transferase [Candidatus Aminicenantes bacterium]